MFKKIYTCTHNTHKYQYKTDRDGDFPTGHRHGALGVEAFVDAELIPVIVWLAYVGGVFWWIRFVCVYVCGSVIASIHIHRQRNNNLPMRPQRCYRPQERQHHEGFTMPPRPRVAHGAFERAERALWWWWWCGVWYSCVYTYVGGGVGCVVDACTNIHISPQKCTHH